MPRKAAFASRSFKFHTKATTIASPPCTPKTVIVGGKEARDSEGSRRVETFPRAVTLFGLAGPLTTYCTDTHARACTRGCTHSSSFLYLAGSRENPTL